MNSNTCTTRNPLAVAYRPLMEAGWEVLPLPYGQKSAPPLGTTGVGGQALTEDQVADYTDQMMNIAVRLPEILIGIDVDGRHGGWESLDTNIEKWGELPEGWFGFTSRTLEDAFAPEGGLTMFFRIPAGIHLKETAGAGIDIIQHTHRYAVAPGSLHPDHGGTYRAINSRLQEVPVELLYAPEEAPELPGAWLEALTLEIPRTFREAATEPIKLDPTVGTCAYMEAILARHLGLLRHGKDSRHSLLRNASWAMIKEAGKGHQGADAALEVYLKDWHGSFTVIEKKTKRGHGLVAEANALIANAKAHTDAPSAPCTCGTRKVREELTDWDRRWIAELTPAQRVALRNPHQIQKTGWGATVDATDEEARQEALQAVIADQASTRARNAAKAGRQAPTAAELAVTASTASFTRRSPEEMQQAREKSLPTPARRSRPRTASAMGFSSMRGR